MILFREVYICNIKYISKSSFSNLVNNERMGRMLKRKGVLLLSIVLLITTLANIPSTLVNANQVVSTSIKLGETYYDSISNKNDEKWYQFTTTEAGSFSLEFIKSTIEKNEWQVELYDADKDLICSHYTSEDSELTTGEYGYAAGTYYIRVLVPYPSLWYSSSQYGIKINFQATDYWEKEKKNKSFDQSNSLIINKSYQGNLYTNKDEDYYRFKLTSAGYFNIQFDKVSNSASEWCIEIYDSDRDLITKYITQDSNKMTTSNFGFAKGTYYVKVYAPYNYLYYNSSNYALKVNFKKSSAWESEKNNSIQSADKLTLEKSKINYTGSMSGLLHKQNDVDYYKVIVTKTAKLTLSFKHDYVEGGQWKVTLCKKDGTVLSSVENKTASSKLSKTLSKGTYYIKVEANYSSLYYSSQQYKLTATYK